MASNPMGSDIPKELEEALHRVIVADTLAYSKLLQELKELKINEKSIHTAQLLAKQEILHTLTYDPEKEILSEEQLEELQLTEKEERDQLHKALLKHAVLADALQNAAFQTQIQNSFYGNLRDSKNDEKTRSILANYNSNLRTNAELINMTEKCEDLEKDIIDLRLKYRDSLSSVSDKWKVVTNLEAPSSKYKTNPEARALEEKLLKRETRMDLITGLLQGLISNSDEAWGENPRLLQVMMLCDAAQSQAEDSSAVRENIDDLRSSRQNQEKDDKAKHTPRGIRSFVTSTPHNK